MFYIVYGFLHLGRLIILNMLDFKFILDMGWLSPYHTVLNYTAKIVTLNILGRVKLEWEGVYKSKTVKKISFVQPKKLVGRVFILLGSSS